MDQLCDACGTSFTLTPLELQMHEKFGFEPLSFCFECGQKRRLCFRNARNLYKRRCDLTGQHIVSMYAPDKPYIVYSSEAWNSDDWDTLEYGRDFDFNRPFFEQFEELLLVVPRNALTNVNSTNSPYCNMCEGNKNCHLILGGDFNEDSFYGIFCMYNKSVVDCDTSNNNESCYYMNDSFDCYGCQFTFDSKNCNDCAFISDCTGCSNCILCTNLTKQSFCIENQQFSKEEYEVRKQELLNGSYSQQMKNWNEFLKMRDERIVKYAHILSSENCTGDYIKGSKGCQNCYDTWDCEDTINIILAAKNKDGINSGCIGHKSELCYNMQSTVAAYNCAHSFTVLDSKNIDYSSHIINSQDLFGCCGMNHYQYCILNKQYKKDEYQELRSKIIEHMKKTGEWGQFFPPGFSEFGYNESTAQDYFPMEKDQILKEGFNWYDKPEEKLDVEKVIPADKLPDNIDDIPDDILNWAVQCEKTGRPFRLVKQELDFYRTHKIPVPHVHPDQRYLDRYSMRNPKQLWQRTCEKCGKEVETTYAPERKETVYCEECYLKEVY